MKTHRLVIKSRNAPVVELDSEAHAAYVRFSKSAVAKTLPVTTHSCIVTVDLDSSNEVVGIELIGVDEFGIEPLLQKAGFSRRDLPKNLGSRARYVPVCSPAEV